MLTSGNCVSFCSCCLFLFLFESTLCLKVRWGKSVAQRKIGKLETNFKNFALAGRKKALQTNYTEIDWGLGEDGRTK